MYLFCIEAAGGGENLTQGPIRYHFSLKERKHGKQ
jgi:hypothetical protein